MPWKVALYKFLIIIIYYIVFLWSEFKLENICIGVNFCGKTFAVLFICGNLFADRWKNRRIKKRENFEPNGIFQALIAKLFDSKKNESYAAFFLLTIRAFDSPLLTL